MGVMRLGYMHVRVTDLEEAKQHYSNTLGMNVVAEDGATAHLKCWDEWDHHSLVLEEGGVGMVKAGYKCATAEDLDTFEHRAVAFGATVSRMSKGDNLAVGDGIRVVLPSDHVIELYHDIDYGGPDRPLPRHRRGPGHDRTVHDRRARFPGLGTGHHRPRRSRTDRNLALLRRFPS